MQHRKAAKPLAVPLLNNGELETGAVSGQCRAASAAVSRAPLLGLTCVTTAALLFGVVAAFVKMIVLPTLVLQLVRSIVEWMLGIAAALVYWRRGQLAARRDEEMMGAGCDPAVSSCASNRPSPSGVPTDLMGLLLGPAHLRGWLLLRALLYWLFLACWWFALASMPIGDATTIVYVGPVFTATFAYLFLGERIDWSFYIVVVLDAAGLLLITQPTFLFPAAAGAAAAADDNSYYIGALSSFISAVVAGLLPICTRKSKAGQLVQHAVYPVGGQRPVCLPGPSEGPGRSYAPQSASRADRKLTLAPGARLRPPPS